MVRPWVEYRFGVCSPDFGCEVVEQSLSSARHDAHNLWIVLIVGTGCSHCVGLARARLTICENGHIVPFYEGRHAVAEVLPHAILSGGFVEDAVEDEELLALRRLDGETGGCWQLTRAFAEALRDQVISRV